LNSHQRPAIENLLSVEVLTEERNDYLCGLYSN
jgi:hypothetical protein